MPIYVLMTTLAPSSIAGAVERKGKGEDWLHKISSACPEVRWIGHYALLGRYDFMDIYEAPDDETAHKVSLISRGEGAISAESWPAIRYEQHLKLLEQLEN